MIHPARTAVHGLLTLLVATLVGCASSDSATTLSPSDSPDSGTDAAGEDGGETVTVAPSSFDCTSLPALPQRVSTTPADCPTDRTCVVRMVSGHRGAGGEMGKLAPEDTLASYRAAIALGADFAETDPRPTSDGVLVNVHDTTVDRTTEGSGTVDQMTLEQVQTLKLRTEKFAGDFACERIPTLRQVLETCRQRIHVLVDANKTDRVDLLVADIVAADALDWAIFDTSSIDKITQALALEPRLHVMFRVDSTDQIDAGLTALADHPPVIIEVNGGNLQSLASEIHARGHRVLTDVFVQDVSVGFGGDLSVYEQPFSQGADIAQTDRPELVLHFLGRL